MTNLTIKEHFTFNRRNHRVQVLCDHPEKFLLPRKTLIFIELNHDIKEGDVLEHVFKKNNQGVLTTFDFDLKLAILHNTTFEDILIEKDEPLFILKSKANKKNPV